LTVVLSTLSKTNLFQTQTAPQARTSMKQHPFKNKPLSNRTHVIQTKPFLDKPLSNLLTRQHFFKASAGDMHGLAIINEHCFM
jgi:hypothetical protein